MPEESKVEKVLEAPMEPEQPKAAPVKKQPTQEEVDAQARAYLEKKPVDPSVSEISTYNGAKTQKYNWSQGIRNVDVQIKLPEGVSKSK